MTISGQVGGYWSPNKIVAKTPWRHVKLLGGGGSTVDDEKGNILKVESDTDDTFISTFVFENGIIGHLHWSWFGPPEPIGIPFFTLYGTEGCIKGNIIIRYDGSKISLENLFEKKTDQNIKEKYFPYGIKDPMALETLDFIKAIEEKREMETSGRKGLKDLAAAFAMLESSYLKIPVKVKDVEEGKLWNYKKEINEYYGIV